MTVNIIQGTTPNIVFTLPIATSTISAVEMTISDCNAVKITKSSATYSETYKATFSLTQTETLALDPGDYRLQLRVKTTDNKVYATKLLQTKVVPLASKVSI